MAKKIRRFLAITMALALCFMLTSPSASAWGWGPPGGGNNNDDSYEWYEVYVQGNLVASGQGRKGDVYFLGTHYEAGVNINGNSLTWHINPIGGSSGNFSGTVNLFDYIEIPEGYEVQDYDIEELSIDGVNDPYYDMYDNAVIRITIKSLYNEETDDTIIIPDPGNQNQNPGNTGNNQSGNTTDSTGLTFTSNGNGTCTLSGVGSCKDICIVVPATSPSGDKVTAIGAQAFYNCTSITVVQIPASVTQIGHLAFGGCTNLVYITVSSGNYSYKDIGGVLYTVDGKTLVHYPAGAGASSVSIPASVNKIEDMAFYGCKSLKTIRYGGTQDAWSRIAVGSMNYSLNAASVTCQDSGK